ncbi:MAG: DoxX family membrane protein [Bdellovibrionales bacterium]|nr:DoxX family membrane protein [Bdellovibrionales bacterium]
MKKWGPLVARVLLGLVFTGAGIAAFAGGLKFPDGIPEPMATFARGIAVTTYFMPLLKGLEVICGLMLLSGRFVPLALVILAPIVVNILGVHLFMARDGLVLAIVIFALEGYLALFSPYKGPIRALFKAKS